MGVTHLQSYSACLEEEQETRKEWVEKRVRTWGLGKWSSTLNIDFFLCVPHRTTLMLFCLHVVRPIF